MKQEEAENKRDRTTIRTDMGTRERIKKLAQQMGMTQEKLLEWVADQMEAGIQNPVDHIQQAVYQHVSAVYQGIPDADPGIPEADQSIPVVDHDTEEKEHGIPESGTQKDVGKKRSQPDDISNHDLLLEIKSVKKVVYRIVKELCRITDADVKDPDSGITIQTKYDDRLLNPEKYRRKG